MITKNVGCNCINAELLWWLWFLTINNKSQAFFLMWLFDVYVIFNWLNKIPRFVPGVTRSIERIREIPEYSGKYSFPVISWNKSKK